MKKKQKLTYLNVFIQKKMKKQMKKEMIKKNNFFR